MNLRPSGYEPDELPDCSIPRYYLIGRTRSVELPMCATSLGVISLLRAGGPVTPMRKTPTPRLERGSNLRYFDCTRFRHGRIFTNSCVWFVLSYSSFMVNGQRLTTLALPSYRRCFTLPCLSVDISGCPLLFNTYTIDMAPFFNVI